METHNFLLCKNGDLKQCKLDEIIEISDSPPPSHIETVIDNDYSVAEVNELFNTKYVQEEPIDLTFAKSNGTSIIKNSQKNSFESVVNNATNKLKQGVNIPLIKFGDPLLSGQEKGCKRKANEPENFSNDVIITNWAQPIPFQNNRTIIIQQPYAPTPSCSYPVMPSTQLDMTQHLSARQQEILMMAKSVFSKRTRTLYHWMYPTASKQQIKQVVSNTWDSMAAQEKNIYIAQVLGRFGYANPNLMVNPQLGQIKELPPMPGIQEVNPKTSELQKAISSISNENEPNEFQQTSSYILHPRKRARYSKKKMMQSLSSASQEFDDDPELSRELAQFSIMFKNQI